MDYVAQNRYWTLGMIGISLIALKTYIYFVCIKNNRNEIINYYPKIKGMTLLDKITNYAYPQAKRSLRPNTTYSGIKQDLVTLLNKKINQNKINGFPQPIAALSANHLNEMRKNLPTVLRFLNSKALHSELTSPTKLIIYNIDTDEEFGKTMYDTLEPVVSGYSMTLEIRQFDFSSYPPHLKNLYNFSWKVTICLQTMLEFDAIYYFDTSVTPLYDEEEKHYKSLAKTVNDQMNKFKECYLFTLKPSSHAMDWATCRSMYKYIKPKNQTIWSPRGDWRAHSRDHLMEQAGGSAWLIRDKKCVKGLFLPLYLCAMEANCIQPPQSQGKCADKHLKENPCLSACHRYDQSLTNLVVGNYYNFDKRKYTVMGRLTEKFEALNKKVSWKPEDVVHTDRSG